MYVGAMYELADSWRNQNKSGVRLMTWLTQPICTKIGRIRARAADGLWLLQRVGVFGQKCEVVSEGDMCLSLKCRSLQIVGATSTEVAS